MGQLLFAPWAWVYSTLHPFGVGKSSTVLYGWAWRDAFTCVGWQVTLCDPIWQVMSHSSEMGFPGRAISAITFTFNCVITACISLPNQEFFADEGRNRTYSLKVQ